MAKLNPSGTGFVYATFVGGANFDWGRAIAVDSAGNAYVAGQTQSTDFPTTRGALDRTFNVGTCPRCGIDQYDAFVSKLNPSGSRLVYSTLLGGAGTELPAGVQVDAAGDAVVAGGTRSADFPGASGAGAGFDAFVTELNASGTAPLYSTVIGGSANDTAGDLALDAAGDAYVVGSTLSADFPAPGGTGGGFALELDPAGARDYATRLNGTLRAVVPAADGSAWLAGAADASGFVSADAFDPFFAGGGSDAYVARLDPAGSALTFGSFLGGSSSEYGSDVALDGQGGVYLVGHTSSSDFTTTPGAFDRTCAGNPLVFWGDGFVAKVDAPVASPTGPPAAPTLLGPSADARFGPGQPIAFDWIQVDGASSYTIQIDDSDRFSAPLVAEQTLTASSYTTSTLPTTKLWWRVRANDGGAWSAVRRFEVK